SALSAPGPTFTDAAPHIRWSLWAHSVRWQAPTEARTLGSRPWVPVSMNVAHWAWSVLPPIVMPAAPQWVWSLNEQFDTAHSVTGTVTVMMLSLVAKPGPRSPISSTVRPKLPN